MKFSALGLFPSASLPSSLGPLQGFVSKHSSNPLLVQDVPWEPRLDNAYPNVIQDPDSHDYQIFYGNCISSPGNGAPGCGQQTLHYAKSSDGIEWEKPDLGLFDLSTKSWVRDDLQQYGTHNNIIMKGGGVGVTDDVEKTGKDDDCRFKAFGEGQFLGTTEESESVKHGIGCSPDGLVWNSGQTLSFPEPQRYDTHSNVQWHPGESQYLYSTRAGFSDAPGRCAGAAMGENGAFSKYDVDFDSFYTTEEGSNDAQIYAQLPFPVLDVYLAHSMVYDAEDSENGRVHCMLSWSPDGINDWQFVEGDQHGPRDFVPLGEAGSFDSNVCFASTQPFVDATSGLTSVYYMGGNGPHSGDRNSSLGLATLETFDRFAGIGGVNGTATSATELEVAAGDLVVTADSLAYGGDASGSFVKVGVTCDSGCGGFGLEDAVAVKLGGQNATDAVAQWKGGDTLAGLQGQKVTVQVEIGDAIVYSVGFV